MNNFKKFANTFVWLLVLWVVVSMLFNETTEEVETQGSYSSFISELKSGGITRVILEGSNIEAERMDGSQFSAYNPGDLGLMGDLINSGAEVITKPPKQDGFLKKMFVSLLPILLLLGGMVWLTSRQSGGSGGVFGVGKSKAKMAVKEHINLTFDDVAGAEEAKDDVAEVVDFLKNPNKYRDLGGNIPRGILLTGPPGTGKTLIAKAVAGEADVPFFYTSGSDFVEMFVGVGASRVRDMFEQAKKMAPCIIFIDEIDAIGRKRGEGSAGGNEEREQTLNQILVQMDGFEGSSGVIVMAATNRPDVLDHALLRPGRFDRQVVVGLPDIKGRKEILQIHAKKIKISDDISLKDIARGTPGFSGADLANLINEAALIAASADAKHVAQADLESAKDKILMGAERKSMVMDVSEKEMTAYHEAGHAIVGRLVPKHDPVYKVSIIPRGRALGVTMFLPEKDNYSVSFEELNGQIAALFGGRIAEELIFGKNGVSTGASNDIERATQIARNMVEKWGMSNLGPISFEKNVTEIGLEQSTFSSRTTEKIDEEINEIIKRNYDHAKQILESNRDILSSMTAALMKYETIDSDQIDVLMSRGDFN